MDIFKFFFRLTLMLAIPAIVAGATFYYMRDLFFVAAQPGDSAKVMVEVKADRSFVELGKDLVDKGLLKGNRVLDVLQRFTGKGKGKQIKEGEYELSPGMTPMEILDKLLSGDVYLRQVRIEAGSSVWELGKLLEAKGITAEKDFNQGLTNAEWLRSAGIRAESFEGYFWPDSYSFSKLDGVHHVIWTMMERAEKQWPPEFTKLADDLEMSRQEVLTLASIIQKEASNPDDMANLSSVYHNRINVGMKLEADSTVIYGLKNFNGTLTPEDLKAQHLYNTHFYYGLPPGPICNPGMDAIKAALNPLKTSFLFYVRDGGGRLVFSANHREYEETLKKYKEFNKLRKSEA